MYPFYHIGRLTLPSYGSCIALGIIISGIYASFLIKKRKLDINNLFIYAAVAIGMGFIFAKLLFLMVTYSFADLIEIIRQYGLDSISESGFVFYGGIIGGIIGLFIGRWMSHSKIKDYIDIFAIVLPLAHAFGRVGCFLAGCCYGIPYNGIFSVKYANPITAVPANVNLFPVQLLEAILNIIVFIVLVLFNRKERKPMSTTLLYILLYSVERFLIEFLRFDAERGSIGVLSTSQIISIAMLVASIFIMTLRFKVEPIE